MKIVSLLIVTLVSLAGCAPDNPPAPEVKVDTAVEVADTVYTNGSIYTVDKAHPWVEAVAIRDGRFIVVGSVADVGTVTGDDTEVVDLKGAFVMPGVGDTHIHPALVMPKQAFCSLPGTFFDPTEEQTLAILRE